MIVELSISCLQHLRKKLSIICYQDHYMQYNWIWVIIINLFWLKVTTQSECWESHFQFHVISIMTKMSIILSHYHYMQYNYIRLIIINLIIIKVTAQSQCWEPNTQFEVISVSSRLVSIETFENERNGNFPSNLNCWVIHQLSLSIQFLRQAKQTHLIVKTCLSNPGPVQ